MLGKEKTFHENRYCAFHRWKIDIIQKFLKRFITCQQWPYRAHSCLTCLSIFLQIVYLPCLIVILRRPLVHYRIRMAVGIIDIVAIINVCIITGCLSYWGVGLCNAPSMILLLGHIADGMNFLSVVLYTASSAGVGTLASLTELSKTAFKILNISVIKEDFSFAVYAYSSQTSLHQYDCQNFWKHRNSYVKQADQSSCVDSQANCSTHLALLSSVLRCLVCKLWLVLFYGIEELCGNIWRTIKRGL